MRAARPDGGLRKADISNRVTWLAFGLAAAFGAAGALCIVLGVDVLVNPMLAVAAGAVHAVAVVIVITVGADLWTAAASSRQRCSDLHPVAVALLALLGAGAVVLAVVIDRLVVNSGFPRRYIVLYVVVGVAMTLVAAAVTIHVLRPDTTRLQLPAVRALAAVLGLVVGATAIGGWAGAAAWQRNRMVPHGPDLEALAPIRGIDGTYVALGDSYSAGEGLRPFDEWTGDGCHRSSRGFPRLLRFAEPAPAERFVACSGAVSFDVFGVRPGSDRSATRPPQVPAGVHPDVGLVTITIGGNDVVFSKVVVHCFLHTDCLDAPFRSPRGDPARELAFPPTQPLGGWAEEALTTVRAKVQRLYPQLATRFPNARILVVGYPYLFPDRPAPVLDLSDCQSILRRFSRGERIAVRALQDQLNEVLYAEALAAGIEFVSPAAGWDGHEPCGPRSQYTNSIKPFVQFETAANLIDGGTFHPNVAGQRQLAHTVTCYLTLNPTQPPAAPELPPPGSIARPLVGC